MQSVTQVTAKRDGTASKVTLIVDFKSKLWHPRIIAVRQLKTWREEEASKKMELEANFAGKWQSVAQANTFSSKYIKKLALPFALTFPLSINIAWTYNLYILLGRKGFILELENN